MKKQKSPIFFEKLPNDRHLQEWINSGVLPEIISSNVISCSGDNAYERLLYGPDKSERTNSGQLRKKWLTRYDHLDHGGWWCGGIDLITLEDSQWGCFKPDRPKLNRGKALKYEAPPSCRAGTFALKVEGKALEKFPDCPKNQNSTTRRAFLMLTSVSVVGEPPYRPVNVGLPSVTAMHDVTIHLDIR